MTKQLTKLQFLSHGLNFSIESLSNDSFVVISNESLKTIKVGTFKDCSAHLRELNKST